MSDLPLVSIVFVIIGFALSIVIGMTIGTLLNSISRKYFFGFPESGQLIFKILSTIIIFIILALIFFSEDRISNIFNAIVAIGTIILAMVTLMTVYESRTYREEMSRPRISVVTDIEQLDHPNDEHDTQPYTKNVQFILGHIKFGLWMWIKNYGNSAALSIKISSEIPEKAFDTTYWHGKEQLIDEIQELPPNEKVCLAILDKDFVIASLTEAYSVHVEYQWAGKKYSEEHILNLLTIQKQLEFMKPEILKKLKSQ